MASTVYAMKRKTRLFTYVPRMDLYFENDDNMTLTECLFVQVMRLVAAKMREQDSSVYMKT